MAAARPARPAPTIVMFKDGGDLSLAVSMLYIYVVRYAVHGACGTASGVEWPLKGHDMDLGFSHRGLGPRLHLGRVELCLP